MTEQGNLRLIEAVEKMFNTFPLSEKKLTKDNILAYLESLTDMPSELVVIAVQTLRLTNTFLPTVAEIRMLVVTMAVRIPNEDEALHIAAKDVAAWIPGGENRGTMPKLIRDVVTEVGGSYALRNDERGEVSRAFRRVYKERRDALLKLAQGGTVSIPELRELVRPPEAIGEGGSSARE